MNPHAPITEPLESISLAPLPLAPEADPRLAADAAPIIEIADGVELHGTPTENGQAVKPAAEKSNAVFAQPNRRERRAFVKRMQGAAGGRREFMRRAIAAQTRKPAQAKVERPCSEVTYIGRERQLTTSLLSRRERARRRAEGAHAIYSSAKTGKPERTPLINRTDLEPRSYAPRLLKKAA